MKNWVEKNLINSGGKINSRKLNQKWFYSNGHQKEFDYFKSVHQDIPIAVKIVLGRQDKCPVCGTEVFKPSIYCSLKCAKTFKV